MNNSKVTKFEMEHNSKILTRFDDLYDKLKGDNEDFISEEEFSAKLCELIDDGFIETSILDDFTLYSAKKGLQWNQFVHIEDNIKRAALLSLVDNPITFFVLLNTQKGKMRIAALEIKKWGQDRTKKPVAFLIVDNDKTLADQSVDGLKKTFAEQNVKIFPLSSNSKTTFDEIKTYIDAYANDVVEDGMEPEYPMPLIALLANAKQNEKMLKLIHHITNKIKKNNSLLRFGFTWDEADKTYKMLRNLQVNYDGTTLSCYKYIVEDNIGLYRLGFVSATDGDLLEEDYPECANAFQYPVQISPDDEKYYRALHHPESITHRVPFTSRHSNNSYAYEVLNNNKEHFMTPIKLKSGETYYRKIIVNSNARTDAMKDFAKDCNAIGLNAMVFNGCGGGSSVKLYKDQKFVGTYKTKGKRLNELLFYVYKKLNLNDKPLIIIGRRKVDRGLGFHYCPRTIDEIIIDGELGTLSTKDMEGLIWTDMILGRVEDKNIAVQKAGRLAGIIGNSPQYPGSTHYWTDKYTENLIRRHNTIVDKSNELSGLSISQAVRHANTLVPDESSKKDEIDINKYRIYDNEEIIKQVCKILGYDYRPTKNNNNGFKETSLNNKKSVVSLQDAVKKVPTAYGTNKGKTTWRSYYPCYVDTDNATTLRFVLIVRPGTDENKLKECDDKYKSLTL